MKWFIPLVFLLFLSGCQQAESKPSYEETKKMVLDTLQTEDGKETMRKILSDPAFKEMLVLEDSVVKESIEKNIWSEDAKKFWKTTFEDPLFTETFAKSLESQQKDVLKQLMKDPSYQEEWQTFLSDPAMKEELASVFKQGDMRKELQKIVEDVIQNPLMQSKWQELILQSSQPTESAPPSKQANQNNSTTSKPSAQ
ncbi:spore germination lipoprotein GerD [Paenisporosarcina cavernae]|uniref:Spore gernimation protein n=1 Tax=Paenisporosarcina cavernae TaxID=2320858 RepID=A0A385YVK4_9BACL|nr:spore germination lipoprotein GerD [Paenisporosarcina cavernae]AYC30574.1 spore gernimation protein [Paenisporosarcina cavernae]